jgi:hypothetical protein
MTITYKHPRQRRFKYKPQPVERNLSLSKTIIVNGESIEISTSFKLYDYISYKDIMNYIGRDPGLIYSITYHYKDGVCGSLIPGNTIKTVDGMIFSAYDTSNA